MLNLTCQLDGSKIYDPNHKEGAGSLIQFLVSAYLISQKFNIPFYYTPIVNIGHRETFGESQEDWDKTWNTYISSCLIQTPSTQPQEFDVHITVHISKLEQCVLELSKNERRILINLEWRDLKQYLDKNFGELLNLDIQDRLRQTYRKNKDLPKTYFDITKKNIAFHIRNFSKTDCDPNPCRELYKPDSQMAKYFSQMIKDFISNESDSIQIHIYAQGPKEDFQELVNLNPSIVQLHIDEHPIVTLHHLIMANVLVMSKSSFSLIANYYTQAKCILRKGFWHQVKYDTMIIDCDK